MPTEPEVAGLLALIRLHRARAAARFDQNNEIIQLPDQDRSTWDHEAIAECGCRQVLNLQADEGAFDDR